MKSALVLLAFFLLPVSCYSQAPIEWQKCFGGSAEDYGSSILQTSDSSYIIASYVSSTDGDILNPLGASDVWISKISSTGGIVWQQCIGGSFADLAFAIRQTNDNGFVVCCRSSSVDGDVTNNHGSYDFWVVKLDNTGGIEWGKSFGGSGLDASYDIQQTADNGYIIVGYTVSVDGDVTMNNGGNDGWAIKLDANGDLQWQKTYGGTSLDRLYSVGQTGDGGYIMSGGSTSTDGDELSTHGGADGFLIKTDGSGNIQWTKSFGGSQDDEIVKVIPLTSGYYVAGGSRSADGDIISNNGAWDIWAARLDDTGAITWLLPIGGSGDDRATNATTSADGSLIIAGSSTSTDMSSLNHGGNDALVAKVSQTGALVWSELYGGSKDDVTGAIIECLDNKFTFIGTTRSNDGDVSGNHSGTNDPHDIWVVKLEYPTSVLQLQEPTFKVYPTVTSGSVWLEGPTGLDANLELLNMLGQNQSIEIEKKANSYKVSFHDLSEGIYLLRVSTKNTQETYKIIVQ